MARGISIGGAALPVTDASLSFSKDPIREQSMSGLGGEILYKGLYGPGQGSFSGAYRPSVFNKYLTDLTTSPASTYTMIVCDDHGNALTSTNSYLTSAELSVRAGELAKINISFAGRQVTAAGSVGVATYTGEVPVFYNSKTDWGNCSGFTIKIDRQYSADDYKLGGDNFYSQTIYQSGETTVTGTITLSQIQNFDSLQDPDDIEFEFGTSNKIVISGAVLTNAELSVSGRGLITKTFSWACPSGDITFS